VSSNGPSPQECDKKIQNDYNSIGRMLINRDHQKYKNRLPKYYPTIEILPVK